MRTVRAATSLLVFALPAQALDEQRGHFGNSSRKFDSVDTFQNDVVRFHRIGTGERWTRDRTDGEVDHRRPFVAYFPLISSNIRMPSDQQSAAMSWPLFRMISGATYSKRRRRLLAPARVYERDSLPGVPQNVHVFFPRPTFFAKPKSTWTQRATHVRYDQRATLAVTFARRSYIKLIARVDLRTPSPSHVVRRTILIDQVFCFLPLKR